MEFTFFGDLLGIGSVYRLSPTAARERLDKYYNLTFSRLSPLTGPQGDLRVEMFSDSLLVWGRNAEVTLRSLQSLYLALLEHRVLLRGGMVKGRLSFEPRITVENFEKRLPDDDTLVRAVGLEGSHSGSRLLIESGLANYLLRERLEWLTVEGYARHLEQNDGSAQDAFLRRVCPTPDQSCYELLYFWEESSEPNGARLSTWEERICEMASFYEPAEQRHFDATLGVLERSRLRRNALEAKRGLT